MQLNDTIELMTSSKYTERFLAEYMQLRIRHAKLYNMIEAYYCGTATFEPNCSITVLSEQLDVMQNYIEILEERARQEKINLAEELAGRFDMIELCETTAGMVFMYRIKADRDALHFGVIRSNINGVVTFADVDNNDSIVWDDNLYEFRGVA